MQYPTAGQVVPLGTGDRQAAGSTPGEYSSGNPLAVPPALPTQWQAADFNVLFIELANLVQGAGITLNGTVFTQVLQAVQYLAWRIVLRTNAALVVDGTAGNDATGSLTSPFATLQAAWNFVVNRLDLNGFALTITVNNGTYSPLVASGMPPGAGSQLISLVGAAGATVTISNPIGPAVDASYGVQMAIANIALASGGSSTGPGCGVFASNNAFVSIGANVTFSACATAHMSVATNANIMFGGGFAISGSAPVCLSAGSSGVINGRGVVALGSGIAFSSAFADITSPGLITVSGFSYTGAATGQRYLASGNGVINSNSGNANLFPGSSAGSTSTGGLYL